MFRKLQQGLSNAQQRGGGGLPGGPKNFFGGASVILLIGGGILVANNALFNGMMCKKESLNDPDADIAQWTVDIELSSTPG